MSAEPTNKILIIGAGLGGLALAQILYANNVPFEIFERDPGTAARLQGWAVALVESLPMLEELLPEVTAKDLHTNSVNFNSGDNDEVAFVNSLTGERVAKLGGVPHGEPDYFLRVSRERLRTYFWQKNNLPVSANKYFTHYEQDDNGVTAFFKDGTSARGSLLIGADGLHSHVLDQLIGESHHKPVFSKWVPIVGEVELPPSVFEPIRKLSTAITLAGSPGIRQQIGQLDIAKDGSSAHFFWAFMVPRENPKELSDWVQTASQEELYDFVANNAENLHPTMNGLMKYGGAAGISKTQLRFLEFVPPNTMPAGRVTVLGDAAHAMIPFRGAGANTAILDSCDLAKLLIKANRDGQDPVTVLDEYHTIMLPRGKENVLSSRAAGEGDDNPAEHWKTAFARH